MSNLLSISESTFENAGGSYSIYINYAQSCQISLTKFYSSAQPQGSTISGLGNNTFFNNTDLSSFTYSMSIFPLHVIFLNNNFSHDYLMAFQNSDVHKNEKLADIIQTYQTSNFIVASGVQFSFSVLLLDRFDQLLFFGNNILGTLSCSSKSQTITLVITEIPPQVLMAFYISQMQL